MAQAAAARVKAIPLVQRKRFYEWLIFLFAFCLFANSIPNDYNIDDELVTNNHRLTSKGIAAIPEIFTSPYYQDQAGYAYEYRPVVLTSFAIEHQIFGDNPHVGHFINVLLYALCCLLLFIILQLLFKNYPPLILPGMALLFAAHPAHTEVVCSIKNRDEILGLIFSLLALYVSLKALKNRRIGFMPIVALFYALALMCKASSISFAVIIPLAMILFSDADIYYMLALTFALILPLCFLLTMTSGFEKFNISILLTLSMLVFYIVTRKGALSHFIQAVTRFVKNIIRRPATEATGKMDINSPPRVFSKESLLHSVIPEKQVWSVFPICINVTLAVTYIFLIRANYSTPAILPVSILLLLAWRGEKRISWWANVMLGFCLSAALLTAKRDLDIYRTQVITELFAIYLAAQLRNNKAGFLITLVLLYLLTNFLIQTSFTGRDYDCIIFPFLMLLLLRYPLLFIAYAAGFWYKQWLLHIPVAIVIFAAIVFKKKEWIPVGAALVLLIFFHTNHVGHDYPLNAKYKVEAITDKINPEILSVHQNRPLTWLEECVSDTTPFSVRAGTSLEILFNYLHKVILPYPMSYYYGYKFIYPEQITDLVPLLSLAFHLLLLLAAFILLRKQPALAFAIFIYLASILTVSNYFQHVPGMLADRFLLIPSIGWVIGVVLILAKLFRFGFDRNNGPGTEMPAALRYSFAGILLLYSVITFSRNFEWKDDLTLFRHDIHYADKSAQAHNLLALHLMKNTETPQDEQQKISMEKEALFHFERSEEIYPYFFNVRFDIGRVFSALNMPDSAIEAYKSALILDSTFDYTYQNLGNLLIKQKKFEEAIPYFARLISLRPDEYSFYERLSYIYYAIHRYDESIAVNIRASERFINNPEPLVNIGETYVAKNQPDSALLYLNKAGQISPGNPAIQQLIQKIHK
jgi:tetratricopeptide (TPR) repeat protein